MSDFSPIHPDSATPDQQAVLDRARQTFGMVPNLISTLAHAPAAANAYLDLHEALGSSSFTPVEQQVLTLTASRINGCTYCMAAESAVGKMAGVSDEVLNAVRSASDIPDARLQALADFTAAVVEKRGWASDADVRAFVDAGYDRSQVLEVVLGVTKKTLSNYANHIAGTEVDKPFRDFAWEPAAPVGAGA